MTAGRSAGTEQGQGWECAICDDSGIYLGHRCSFCQPPWDPSPSVPPARDSGLSERSVKSTEDSGRDEAREAVARALRSHVAFFWGVTVGVPHEKLPEFWDEVASVALDAMPPAIAALLRDGTTT